MNNLKDWQQQEPDSTKLHTGVKLELPWSSSSRVVPDQAGHLQLPETPGDLLSGLQQVPASRKPKWFSSATFFSRQSGLIKPTYIWPHNLKRYSRSLDVKETSGDK